jgi:hypothetical protein
MVTRVTESLIKSRAATFDLESVFSLSLSGLRLVRLESVLNGCVWLWELDVSGNALDSLAPLDGAALSKLRVIDASHNRLASAAAVPESSSVDTLYLQGNRFASLDELTVLSRRLPALRVLHMQQLDGAHANPLCSDPAYRDRCRALFTRLQVLDGERIRSAANAAVTALLDEQNKADTLRAAAAAAAVIGGSAAHSKTDDPDGGDGGGGVSRMDLNAAEAELSRAEAPIAALLADCKRLDSEAAATLSAVNAKLKGPSTPTSTAAAIVAAVMAAANASSLTDRTVALPGSDTAALSVAIAAAATPKTAAPAAVQTPKAKAKA